MDWPGTSGRTLSDAERSSPPVQRYKIWTLKRQQMTAAVIQIRSQQAEAEPEGCLVFTLMRNIICTLLSFPSAHVSFTFKRTYILRLFTHETFQWSRVYVFWLLWLGFNISHLLRWKRSRYRNTPEATSSLAFQMHLSTLIMHKCLLNITLCPEVQHIHLLQTQPPLFIEQKGIKINMLPGRAFEWRVTIPRSKTWPSRSC